MKKKLKNILLAGFVGATLSLANTFQTNAQENYTPKYNTIGHEVVKIYKGEKGQKYLDNIIDSTKSLFNKKKYSEKEAKDLMIKTDSILDRNFKSLDDSPTPCFDKALGYLAVAREKNLPLELVCVPKSGGHVYVRWDPDGKHNPLVPNDTINKGDFGWEVTSGKFVEDDQYWTSLISKNSIKKNIYLTNLSDSQIISKAYCSKAVELANQGKFNDALKNCNISLNLDSNEIKAHYVKGFCYNKLGDYNEANKYFNDALKLNPQVDIYFSKASNHEDMLENEKAISFYDSTITLANKVMDETFSYSEKERMKKLKKAGLFWKSLTYVKIGEEDKAEIIYKEFKEE